MKTNITQGIRTRMKIFRPFVNHRCVVSVPNRNDTKKPFFYRGVPIEVDARGLFLRREDNGGILVLDLNSIIEIFTIKEEQ